jgi:hypothetical protein
MRNFLIAITIPVLFLSATPALAQSSGDCPSGRVCLKNPLGNAVDAEDIIGNIIKGVLGVLGSLALFMMVWGGFQWLTSAGSKEKVAKGSRTMMWALIGVVVVLASYILVDAVLNAITG